MLARCAPLLHARVEGPSRSGERQGGGVGERKEEEEERPRAHAIVISKPLFSGRSSKARAPAGSGNTRQRVCTRRAVW